MRAPDRGQSPELISYFLGTPGPCSALLPFATPFSVTFSLRPFLSDTCAWHAVSDADLALLGVCSGEEVSESDEDWQGW